MGNLNIGFVWFFYFDRSKTDLTFYVSLMISRVLSKDKS